MAKKGTKKQSPKRRVVTKSAAPAAVSQPTPVLLVQARSVLYSALNGIAATPRWVSNIILSLYRLALIVLFVSVSLWLLSLPNWHWAFMQFNGEMVLRYLTVLIWPLVIIVALAVIRPDVPKILKRGFTFIFPWGGSMEVSPESSQAATPSNANREVLEEASEELQRVEESEKKEKAVSKTAENDTLKSGVTGYTLNVKNQTKLVAHFEQANQNITGSQLQALTLLGTFLEGLTEENLQGQYLRYKDAPTSYKPNASFMDFMHFLVGWFFVDYSPTDRIFKITDIGMQFLEYRIDKHLKLTPENAKR